MYSGKTVQRVNNKNTLNNLPHPRVPDDFSRTEMMCGLAQQVVQEVLKTEVHKLDEELGNDYKAKQQVYRAMIARINREEREDEEGS